MTEVERQAETAKAKGTIDQLCEGLAPTFVGRTCPLKNGAQCDGPRCMLYAAFDENPDPAKPGRVTNGACGYLLAFQQLNQLSVGFDGLARAMSNMALAQGTRIIGGRT